MWQVQDRSGRWCDIDHNVQAQINEAFAAGNATVEYKTSDRYGRYKRLDFRRRVEQTIVSAACDRPVRLRMQIWSKSAHKWVEATIVEIPGRPHRVHAEFFLGDHRCRKSKRKKRLLKAETEMPATGHQAIDKVDRGHLACLAGTKPAATWV